MTIDTGIRPLNLHRLTFHDDHGEVVIGRIDIDSFAIFPPDAADLVRRLHDGTTPREAADWYQTNHGESVDIDDLIETLRVLDFVQDGVDVTAEGPPATPPPPRGQRFAQRLFSVPGTILTLGIIALAGWFMSRNPWLKPSREHLFIPGLLTLSMAVLILGQIPGLLIHEGFHALAGRRLGLPTKIRVSRRMIYLVVETQIHGLASVPRRKRYLPYAAGLIGDALWFSILTITAGVITNATGHRTTIAGLVLSLAFATMIRTTWQFYLNLQTDAYFVIADVLRVHDLHRITKAVLRQWTGRLVGRRGPALDKGRIVTATRRELIIARLYTVPFLFFTVFSVVFTFVYLVPVALRFVFSCIVGVAGHGSTGAIWDSGVALSLTVLQFGIVGWLAVKSWRQRRSLGFGHAHQH